MKGPGHDDLPAGRRVHVAIVLAGRQQVGEGRRQDDPCGQQRERMGKREVMSPDTAPRAMDRRPRGRRPTIIDLAVAKGGSTLLTIDERRVGDVTILELRGRLVLYDGELPFRTAVDRLVQEGRRKIVVDLRNVDYIDSAGVGILVGKYLSLRRLEGDVKLLHPSPRTLRVMGIAHLLEVFETYETEEAAIQSFHQGTKTRGT